MTPEAAAWRRRDLAPRCRACRAVPGQPCRVIRVEHGGTGESSVVIHIGPARPPHRERLLAAIFGARP